MRDRERKAAWVVAAVIAFAPFAIGGAPRWAACATAALCLLCVVPLVGSRRAAGEVSPLLVFLGLAAGFTALQIVPLPALLVAQIAPATYQLLIDNAAALGQPGPSTMMLSLDPPATLLELAKLAGYVAFAFACLRIAATRKGQRWLLAAVAVVGGAMATVALAHYMVGASSVFGLYAPKQAHPRLVAPLLNSNHLTSLMALAAPVALGVAVTLRGRARLSFVGIATLCASTGLLSGSRAGAVALALGLLLAGGIILATRNRIRKPVRKPPRSTAIAMGVAGACALVLLGTLTAGGVLKELSATSTSELGQETSKFAAWRSAVVLLKDHRWTGVGRGGFEAAFTRVNKDSQHTVTHLENEYLQAAIDWGIAASAVMALALILLTIAALRRANTSPLAAGAFGGVTAVALHSAFDFGLELPGLAIPAIATLAALLHSEFAERRRTRISLKALRGTAITLGLITVALAAGPLARTSRNETSANAAPLRAGTLGIRAAAATFGRHPADYLAAAHAAQVLLAKRDVRAVALINRALYLNPRHSGVHHLAAQILERSQQPSQALVEYALALGHTNAPLAILRELTHRFPDTTRAVRGIPIDVKRMHWFLRDLHALGKHELAFAYVRVVVDELPENPYALRKLATLALRAKDIPVALDASQRLWRVQPTHATALFAAKNLRASGDHVGAAKLMRSAIDGNIPTPSPSERGAMLSSLADALIAAGTPAEARTLLRQAISLAPTRETAAKLHLRLAKLEDAAGNSRAAAAERARARSLAR